MRTYTGNPFCPANSFSDTCGRAPMCWITSAAASAPSRPAASIAGVTDQPEQEAGGEEIAGAGGVHQLFDREGRHRGDAILRGHHAAFLAAGDDSELGIVAELFQRTLEIRGLVQRVQLGLIGEHEVDRAFTHQVEKLVTITIDAERIRQRQRHLAAGAVCECPRP